MVAGAAAAGSAAKPLDFTENTDPVGATCDNNTFEEARYEEPKSDCSVAAPRAPLEIDADAPPIWRTNLEIPPVRARRDVILHLFT